MHDAIHAFNDTIHEFNDAIHEFKNDAIHEFKNDAMHEFNDAMHEFNDAMPSSSGIRPIRCWAPCLCLLPSLGFDPVARPRVHDASDAMSSAQFQCGIGPIRPVPVVLLASARLRAREFTMRCDSLGSSWYRTSCPS